MKLFTTPLLLLFAMLVMLSSTGCYNYRVTAYQPDPGTEYQSKTVHSLFWGLAQSKNVAPENCKPVQGLDEVHIKHNFGFSLLTVITLGIWCPTTVQWKCSKPCPTVGDL